MKESMFERAVYNERRDSYPLFGERGGRWGMVYRDDKRFAEALVGRIIVRSPFETARVARAQQVVEKALRSK